jgi:hypothetical protein
MSSATNTDWTTKVALGFMRYAWTPLHRYDIECRLILTIVFLYLAFRLMHKPRGAPVTALEEYAKEKPNDYWVQYVRLMQKKVKK